MGFYIDPKDKSKEEWLRDHGHFVLAPDLEYYRYIRGENRCLVCLVDNVMFTAAGICYSEKEFLDFQVDDGRRKSWFSVAIADLKEVSPHVPLDLST